MVNVSTSTGNLGEPCKESLVRQKRKNFTKKEQWVFSLSIASHSEKPKGPSAYRAQSALATEENTLEKMEAAPNRPRH